MDGASSVDVQSNQLLLRALYVHSSKLLGHLVVFLRHVSISCQPNVKKSSQSSYSPLSNASLLLGRLAWLLKLKGRFLEDVLGCIKPAYTPGKDFISEDQLFSAFEIVDTSGTGTVIIPEAKEAIHALSLEGNELEDVFTFLKAVPLASLTYSEFALLCAGILAAPSDHRIPVERLLACLNTVIATAHIAWANNVSYSLSIGFQQSLSSELCVQDVINVL